MYRHIALGVVPELKNVALKYNLLSTDSYIIDTFEAMHDGRQTEPTRHSDSDAPEQMTPSLIYAFSSRLPDGTQGP